MLQFSFDLAGVIVIKLGKTDGSLIYCDFIICILQGLC